MNPQLKSFRCTFNVPEMGTEYYKSCHLYCHQYYVLTDILDHVHTNEVRLQNQ